MKKCLFVVISLAIISCSSQRIVTGNSGSETTTKEKSNTKSSEEMISELRQRIDSLIDKMNETAIPYTKNVFDSTMNNGALGDVKYSVLPPNEFYKINGDCWHLLDSSNFVGTDLYRKTRNTGLGAVLPDGRGVFLRGMMFNKKDTISGDPSRNRSIGMFQKDTVGAHNHIIHVDNTHEDINEKSPEKNNFNRGGWRANWYTGNSKTELSVGPETRPKNISLFIYIRVNYLCN